MKLEARHALSTIHSSMDTFPKINRLPPEVFALIPSFLTDNKDLVFHYACVPSLARHNRRFPSALVISGQRSDA